MRYRAAFGFGKRRPASPGTKRGGYPIRCQVKAVEREALPTDTSHEDGEWKIEDGGSTRASIRPPSSILYLLSSFPAPDTSLRLTQGAESVYLHVHSAPMPREITEMIV